MAYTNPIEENLKSGEFRQFYLLFGEEEYLKKQYLAKLRGALLPEGDEMNCAVFEGESISVDAVIETADTVPFFAERRVIIIENSGFFKNAADELTAYLKDAPETTVFVFREKEVDKRGKLYKFVNKEGVAAEFSQATPDLLVAWLGGRARREGKEMPPSVIHEMIDYCGSDMTRLSKEMDKLLSYTLGKDRITVDDVHAICSRQIEGHIFDMVDAVSEKNRRKALALYYDLLALKEPPLRILSLINRQYRILLIVRDMKDKGKKQDAIAKYAEIPPFTVRKYDRIAGKLSMEEIRSTLSECADIEESIKTGRIGDQLGVELFLVKHAGSK